MRHTQFPRAFPYSNFQSTAVPLPWRHIAEVVATEVADRCYCHVAPAATRWLVESDAYPQEFAVHGIEFMRPENSRAPGDQPRHQGRTSQGYFPPWGSHLSPEDHRVFRSCWLRGRCSRPHGIAVDHPEFKLAFTVARFNLHGGLVCLAPCVC